MFFLFICFSLIISIQSDDELYFGILNHQPSWIFHCFHNNSKRVDPPKNDQPLISYECPYPALPIEILPLETDFTFLCRSESRLFWIIVDLYQYNTNSWLIHPEHIEIRITLNDQLVLHDSRSEMTNYTNRLIMINAFYVPFESFASMLDQPVQIQIRFNHRTRPNRCEFSAKDSQTWRMIFDHQCHSSESKTLEISQAQCHFYSNRSKLDDEDFSSPSETNPPDLNLILSINEEKPMTSTSISTPHHHDTFLLEKNFHLIRNILARSNLIFHLLKISIGLLVFIVILLVLFFLYTFSYHYYVRSRGFSFIDRSSFDA